GQPGGDRRQDHGLPDAARGRRGVGAAGDVRVSTADLPEVLPAPPSPAPPSRALVSPPDVAVALPVRRVGLGRHLVRFGVAVMAWTWRWLVGALMCFNLF